MTEDDAKQIAARWMRDYPEVCEVIYLRMLESRDTRRPLTGLQKRALDYIAVYSKQHGFPPTLREIAVEFGHSSPAGAHRLVKKLKQAGYLINHHKFRRSIKLV